MRSNKHEQISSSLPALAMPGPISVGTDLSRSLLTTEGLSLDTVSCCSSDAGISMASSACEDGAHDDGNDGDGCASNTEDPIPGRSKARTMFRRRSRSRSRSNSTDSSFSNQCKENVDHSTNLNASPAPSHNSSHGNGSTSGSHGESKGSNSTKSSMNSMNQNFQKSLGLSRSKTRHVFSDAEKIHAESQPLTLTKFFGHDVRNYTEGTSDVPNFDKTLRSFMEPHIAKARNAREERRQVIFDSMGIDPRVTENMSIASNAYVPYTALRNERAFLFDVETYPLHQILAETLEVEDLSLIHQHSIQDKKTLLSPLLDPKKRKTFHHCYDNFVTSFCIPLLHSLAMEPKIFNDSSSSRNEHEPQRVCYRYQAFPCLRVIRPGEFSIGPHCDMAYGHSMGNINFHIPLTPTFGTNAMYTESHPGREDWHPLRTKSVGLGFSFDGARCLHFTLENTTDQTRVSLDFRIAIYRDNGTSSPRIHDSNTMMRHTIQQAGLGEGDAEEEIDVHDTLCNRRMLKDNYSKSPGYYDEAYVDLGVHSTMSPFNPGPVVHKGDHLRLKPPDKRVGFPF